MTDHRTLATWSHEGTTYTATLHLEEDRPTGLTIEAVAGDKLRAATLPIESGSLEWYAQVWSESKSSKHLTVAAERALAMADRLGYGS